MVLLFLRILSIGIFCASLFHFYVHDTTGMIGITVRQLLHPLIVYCNMQNMDDELVATIIVSFFMQIIGILQMPILFGPTFSPFVVMYNTIQQFINMLFIYPMNVLRQQHQQQSIVDHDGNPNIKTTTTTTSTTTGITKVMNKNKKKRNTTGTNKDKDS
jgi:hypothetical protein